MKLAESLELHTRKLEAGGPGSGCHGPNCGRLSSGKAKELLYKKVGKRDYTEDGSYFMLPDGGSIGGTKGRNPYGKDLHDSHREVAERVLGRTKDGVGLMKKMSEKMGAIRVDSQPGDGGVGFELHKLPTDTQLREMARLAKGKTVYWDIGPVSGGGTFADFQRVLERRDLKFSADAKYKVVLTRESDGVSEGKLGTTNDRVVHRTDDEEEAKRQSTAMPYTKVMKGTLPEENPKTRERVRRKKARTNPDVD